MRTVEEQRAWSEHCDRIRAHERALCDALEAALIGRRLEAIEKIDGDKVLRFEGGATVNLGLYVEFTVSVPGVEG
jgi:predicted ribosome quality control (RQC) complex YloA/Tae2 family protein